MNQNANKHRIYCLLFFLGSLSLTRITGFLLGLLHIPVRVSTLPFFALCLIYTCWIVFVFNLYQEQLLLMAAIYGFYIISYIISEPVIRLIFTESELITVFLFYVPIACLIVLRIDDWSLLYEDKGILYFSDFLILFSFISKFMNMNSINYMSFAYNLLPFWCIVILNLQKQFSLLQAVMLVFSYCEEILFGCRGAFILMTLFLLIIYVRNLGSHINFYRLILKLIALCIGYVAGVYYILPQLLSSEWVKKSYILRRIQSESLVKSVGRSKLYERGLSVILNMNLFDCFGMFHDREVLGIYIHNFLLENLIDFGWVFGGLICLAIFLLFIWKYAVLSGEERNWCLFLFFSLFMRFFGSGSIYEDGVFWIFIAGMLTLKPAKKGGGRHDAIRERTMCLSDHS